MMISGRFMTDHSKVSPDSDIGHLLDEFSLLVYSLIASVIRQEMFKIFGN